MNKDEFQKKLYSLACEYYDEYGCIESTLLTEEGNLLHLKLNREDL